MCGLIGVVGTEDSAYEAFVGLLNLQHRGQDGAGILTVDTKKNQFNMQKGSGLVDNVFSERSFRALRGPASLGHTRYATIGRRDPNLLQPFLDSHAGIAIAHNGNIVNCYPLREQLIKDGQTFATESDSEVILKLLVHYLHGQRPDSGALFCAIEKSMGALVGSYAVAGLTSDCSIFAFRDPDAVRPLVLGHRTVNGKRSYAVASETVALNYLGYNDIEEIGPAEAIHIDLDGNVKRERFKRHSFSPCMFEWVYFARVESEIADTSVYQARFNLGLILAEEIKHRGIEADVVLPVPETSRIAAGAIAEALNLPCRELLIKNRYVNRTFILDDQAARQEAIKRKLFPIAKEIAGKRCLIVDDSIVRGNTAMQIVKLIKAAGAKEVILVSTCPPIAHPCYYGIDFPNEDELVANQRSEEQIARELGADTVVYQSIEGLSKALGQRTVCTGCITGNYPTDLTDSAGFAAQRQVDRSKQFSESMP